MAVVAGSAAPAAPQVDQPESDPLAPPTPEPARSGGRRRAWWLAVVALLVIAGGLGLANRHAVGHQLALSLSEQPAPFTELYFTSPDTLPTVLASPGPDTFTFAVGNHLGRDTSYPYTVTLTTADGTSVVATGAVTVPKARSNTETITLTPASPLTSFVVTVTLAGRAESIHFRGETA